MGNPYYQPNYEDYYAVSDSLMPSTFNAYTHKLDQGGRYIARKLGPVLPAAAAVIPFAIAGNMAYKTATAYAADRLLEEKNLRAAKIRSIAQISSNKRLLAATKELGQQQQHMNDLMLAGIDEMKRIPQASIARPQSQGEELVDISSQHYDAPVVSRPAVVTEIEPPPVVDFDVPKVITVENPRGSKTEFDNTAQSIVNQIEQEGYNTVVKSNILNNHPKHKKILQDIKEAALSGKYIPTVFTRFMSERTRHAYLKAKKSSENVDERKKIKLAKQQDIGIRAMLGGVQKRSPLAIMPTYSRQRSRRSRKSRKSNKTPPDPVLESVRQRVTREDMRALKIKNLMDAGVSRDAALLMVDSYVRK